MPIESILQMPSEIMLFRWKFKGFPKLIKSGRSNPVQVAHCLVICVVKATESAELGCLLANVYSGGCEL
jgi:hypothetical protein